MDRLGIDIGSKTIKGCLLDEHENIVQAFYIRHRSKVKESLIEVVHRMALKTGDRQVEVTVTGSAGMRVAELFDIPFVQEVVALKRAVERYEPDTDVVLEMGGEDTKLIYLSGVPEQRMNTICAGGTGGFIDTMAGMMGARAEDMQRLAMGFKNIYPIASRCAVFAKSDVRPLLNAGASHNDVAASVLDAVCTQAIAGLSAGRPIEGKVLLLGGPFNYIPAMRESFCRVSGLSRRDVRIPENAHLFVVRGAAISQEKSEPISLSEFETQLKAAEFTNEEGMGHLPALFKDKAEYEQFARRHASCKLPRRNIAKASENLFIGVDAGSTTMKVALVDESGALVDYQYDWNQGDVMLSLSWMLEETLKQTTNKLAAHHIIRRSCVVGYGEDFCQAAFGIDEGEVETVAHLRAAQALEPDVDFLMDIGGQDIKCFYIEDGLITDIVLNEACSSGCGSLFDSIARSVYKTKEGFAQEALMAKNPIELGTRCSVFMDSRVKHAQKEGATHGDIAAGVAYATARNALFKVVRQPDFSKVGKHIVVQGGAFANDAILRAFELETKTDVIRPDLSQIMGAWGAALLARDHWMSLKDTNPEAAEEAVSGLLELKRIQHMKTKRHGDRCTLCPNNCALMVTQFIDEDGEVEPRVYVTGNRCERGAIGAGQKPKNASAKRPPDFMAYKDSLIRSYERDDVEEPAPVVGVPKTLALYESFPFWKTFFSQLGMRVVSSGPSNDGIYRKGMGSIPSEGACYPAKLAHGHAMACAEQGAEVVFMPRMGLFFAREGLLGRTIYEDAQECPLIERIGDLVRDNAKGTRLADIPLAVPDLVGLTNLEEAAAPIADALCGAGLSVTETYVADALLAARDEYRAFFDKLAKKSSDILARIDAGEFPGAIVAGHPYHTDPGISHNIDKLLGDLGYAVIERVDYDSESRAAEMTQHPWSQNAEVLHTVAALDEHPKLQLIVPRSFGCGIDAQVADLIHDLVRKDGRIYAELKLDQIVDLAAVRIRLRSLAYASKQRSGLISLHEVISYEDIVEEEARRKQAEQEAMQALANSEGTVPSRTKKIKVSDAKRLGTKGGVVIEKTYKDRLRDFTMRRFDSEGYTYYLYRPPSDHVPDADEVRKLYEEKEYQFICEKPQTVSGAALHIPDFESGIEFSGLNGDHLHFRDWTAAEEYLVTGSSEGALLLKAEDIAEAELFDDGSSAGMLGVAAPTKKTLSEKGYVLNSQGVPGKKPPSRVRQNDGTRIMMSTNGMQPVLVFGDELVDLADVKDAPGATSYKPPKRVHTSGKKIGVSLSNHHLPNELIEELGCSVIENPDDEEHVPDQQAIIAQMETLGYLFIRNRAHTAGAGRATVMDFSQMITFGNDDGDRIYFRDWESAEKWINTGSSAGAMEMSGSLPEPPGVYGHAGKEDEDTAQIHDEDIDKDELVQHLDKMGYRFVHDRMGTSVGDGLKLLTIVGSILFEEDNGDQLFFDDWKAAREFVDKGYSPRSLFVKKNTKSHKTAIAPPGTPAANGVFKGEDPEGGFREDVDESLPFFNRRNPMT